MKISLIAARRESTFRMPLRDLRTPETCRGISWIEDVKEKGLSMIEFDISAKGRHLQA